MADDYDQSWRGNKERKPVKKPEWHQKSGKTTDAREQARRVKLLLLTGAGIVLAVGIWLLIWLLGRTKPMGIMAFADDPRETATELHRPYDPYGYQSASWLLKWFDAQNPGDPLSPRTITKSPVSVRDFDNWIADLVKSENTSLVLYFAVPGRVDGNGDPCLVTQPKKVEGKEEPFPQEIRITTILDKLTDEKKLGNRQILLVFDCDRDTVDVNRGDLDRHFAGAMKTRIKPLVEKTTNLTMILSHDAGQQGWESSAKGVSPFAEILAKSIYPIMPDSGKKPIKTERVFELLKDQMKDWSVKNRPGEQTPIMFPEKIEESDTIRRKDTFYRRPGNLDHVDVPTKPTGSTFELEKFRREADDLARSKVPVNAYTPAAWRQYRELFLRYEKAAMAGDIPGGEALAIKLNAKAELIRKGVEIDTPSEVYTTTLPLARGHESPRMARIKTLPDQLTLSAAASLATGDQLRTVESHLPVMLDHYATKVRKSDALAKSGLWKRPVELRILAERAATVMPADGSFPYAESIWPRVSETIQTGDTHRRRGEDRILQNAQDDADSQATTQSAREAYQKAMTDAGPIQKALRVRNEALADLPFLGRSAAEADQADEVRAAADGWTLTHRLVKQLTERQETNETSAALEKLLATLKTASQQRLANLLDKAPSVSIWRDLQPFLLLPPGLLDERDRVKIVGKINEFAQIEMKDTAKVGELAKDPNTRDRIRKHRKKVAQAMLALGQDEITILLSRSTVVAKLNKAEPDVDTEEFHKEIGLLAEQLRADLKMLSDPDSQKTTDTRLSEPRREFASRLGLTLERTVENVEPAKQTGRENWSKYLEAMARRFATDHWYDETNTPYFSGKIAQALLDDAAKIPGPKPAEDSDDRKETLRLIKLSNFKAEWVVPQRSIYWTNEEKQTLPFRLNKFDLPGGRATVWADLLMATPMVRMTDPPVLMEVDGSGVRKPFQCFLTETPGNSLRIDKLPVKLSAYFRGQFREDQVLFQINRQPDYVATEIRDDNRRSVLALRSDDQFDAGSISILLDFSGSMAFSWDGKLKEKVPDEETRRTKMLKQFRELFKDIPPKTLVTIRCFYSRETTVNGKTEYEARVEQLGPKPQAELANEIQKIFDIKPGGPTPLIGKIEETIAPLMNSFGGQRADDVEHTVVVLTDGIDNSLANVAKYQKTEEYKNWDQDTEEFILKDAAKGKQFIQDSRQVFDQYCLEKIRTSPTKISLHLILLGQQESITNRISKDLFNELNTATYTKVGGKGLKEYYGGYYTANEVDKLKRTLEQALRPKPRLTKDAAQIPTRYVNEKDYTYIPASGLPTNRTNQQVSDLWWWGYVDNGPFELRFGSKEQQIKFDNGLNLFLKLGRKNGELAFTREMYYRDIDQRFLKYSDDRHNDWHLAVVNRTARPGHSLDLLAALDSKVTDKGGSVIEPIVPELTWWDLTVAGEKSAQRFPGTVFVRNVTRYHAPCWNVFGLNEAGEEKDYGVKVTAMTETDLDRVKIGRAIRIRDLLGKDTDLPKTDPNEPIVRCQNDLFQLTVGPEELIDENAKLPPQAKSKTRCLIVRVDDPAGRSIRVRIKDKDLRMKIPVVEHQYYYDTDAKKDPNILRPKVKSCVAVFGPLLEKDIPENAVIELFDMTHANASKALEVNKFPLQVYVKPVEPNAQRDPQEDRK